MRAEIVRRLNPAPVNLSMHERKRLFCFLAVCEFFLVSLTCQAQQPSYDFVITGARVADSGAADTEMASCWAIGSDQT